MKCAQHTAHNPEFEKMGLFRQPPVVAIKRLKDPPTWLKVATTSEKPPTPTHVFDNGVSLYRSHREKRTHRNTWAHPTHHLRSHHHLLVCHLHCLISRMMNCHGGQGVDRQQVLLITNHKKPCKYRSVANYFSSLIIFFILSTLHSYIPQM